LGWISGFSTIGFQGQGRKPDSQLQVTVKVFAFREVKMKYLLRESTMVIIPAAFQYV
jgi:hypothetical protein